MGDHEAGLTCIVCIRHTSRSHNDVSMDHAFHCALVRIYEHGRGMTGQVEGRCKAMRNNFDRRFRMCPVCKRRLKHKLVCKGKCQRVTEIALKAILKLKP